MKNGHCRLLGAKVLRSVEFRDKGIFQVFIFRNVLSLGLRGYFERNTVIFTCLDLVRSQLLTGKYFYMAPFIID